MANISKSFTHKMAAKAIWHRNYVTVTLCRPTRIKAIARLSIRILQLQIMAYSAFCHLPYFAYVIFYFIDELVYLYFGEVAVNPVHVRTPVSVGFPRVRNVECPKSWPREVER